jgi:hypothetical protein
MVIPPCSIISAIYISAIFAAVAIARPLPPNSSWSFSYRAFSIRWVTKPYFFQNLELGLIPQEIVKQVFVDLDHPVVEGIGFWFVKFLDGEVHGLRYGSASSPCRISRVGCGAVVRRSVW